MSIRDDFTLETKRALAERAALRCSFPNCDAVTVGPSDESPTAVSSTGMACHIVSAADGPGARRRVPTMSPDDRRSIANGIWMCYRHGKLIDTDESRFTIEMLRKWRQVAERRAQLFHEQGKAGDLFPLLDLGLADNSIALDGLGDENAIIGDAIADSCVPVLWGIDVGHAIRDAMIELARNAFVHGGARNVSIGITERTISLRDDGGDFNSLALPRLNGTGGGTRAVESLLALAEAGLLVSSRRLEGENATTISLIRSPAEVMQVTPCGITIEIHGRRPVRFKLDVLESCRVIYLILPPYVSPSDVMHVFLAVREMNLAGRQLIFVGSGLSPLVRGQLQEIVPGSRLMILKYPRTE